MGISIMFAHTITHKIIKGSSALELYEKIHCISLFICNKIQQNIEIYIAGHEIIYRQTALSPTDHKIMSNLRIRLVKNRKHEKINNSHYSVLSTVTLMEENMGCAPPPPSNCIEPCRDKLQKLNYLFCSFFVTFRVLG